MASTETDDDMTAYGRPFQPSDPFARVPDTDTALIAEFIAQADVADRTRIKYRSTLSEFAIWLSHPKTPGAGRALTSVNRADVVRFVAYLSGDERYAAPTQHCVKPGLSASARKGFLSSIRGFYRYLISVDLVSADPTDGIARPKVRHKPGLLLTSDELKRLLHVKGTPRDRVQAFLLAYTAARVDEIRCLRWQDVDLEQRTMLLCGKGDKYRMIPIHPRLATELRRWMLCQQARSKKNTDLAAALADPDTAYVLLTRSGRQLAQGAIAKQLKRRATRAGLHVLTPAHAEQRSRVSPHALRRTFATILLNDGHHLDAVADVLGHSCVDTTRKHYAFGSDARKKETVEAFDV